MRHLLSVACFVAALHVNVALADITGSARVVDGDTLQVGSIRIRLSDIDAPERRQRCWRTSGEFRCGQRATAVLRAIIGGRDVHCVEKGRDRYRRVLAICYVSKLDIGGELVGRGWALAYRRYGLTYVRQENEARAAKRGLWGSRFTPPWAWRTLMRHLLALRISQLDSTLTVHCANRQVSKCEE